VPRDHIENGLKLGIWTKEQRLRSDSLPLNRFKKLDELGFNWDPLNEKWDEGYRLLLKFKEREGHCNVPASYIEDEFKLGQWVGTQRRVKESLSKERYDLLTSAGFSWDPYNEQWDVGFNLLFKFKLREGHCNVPQNYYDDNFYLGLWVARQRKKRLNLSDLQRTKLNEIGFVWDALIQRWNLGIENLLSFKQREGHCVVPFNHVENNFNLGQWVSHRRRDKKHLTEERINQLDEIGFVWEVLDDKWEIGFLNLVNFKNREGHCAVQRNHLEAGFELGIWVKTQRVAKDWMPIERLNRLNQLSFIWNLFDEKWEIGFSHLVSFFKREGHSNVTREHIENGFKLGQWIGQNRTKYENLSERRKQRLEELGFNWDVHKEQWDKGYKLLLKFKERQGHCKVPASHIDDEFKLGQWVGTQRREKSKLTIERYRLLDAIGFIWDPLGEQWDKGVFHLIKFKEREGHCSVRYGHIENGFKLGLWVSNKRKEFDKLSAERVNQLNLMGFIW
jgi:ribosomal protein L7Ae-like RNA K-turn-binding protein